MFRIRTAAIGIFYICMWWLLTLLLHGYYNTKRLALKEIEIIQKRLPFPISVDSK
jgi:hypothetical protein